MGVLDDPNVGPAIIVTILVVGICCSVCISIGIENYLNDLDEQERERRRQEGQRYAGQASGYHAVPALPTPAQYPPPAWRYAGQASGYHAVPALPTLAVDIVRECA